MNVPAWPQERLDRWDRITKILARVGAGLLLAATLLPVPIRDAQGHAHWDWWFVDRPAIIDFGGYSSIPRSPLTVLYLLLGLWSLRAASALPLVTRGRRLAMASILLLLFAVSRGSRGYTGGDVISLEPLWVLLLLPPLGLALLWTGAARRLGRIVLIVAGGNMLALVLFPHDWSIQHLELLFAEERGGFVSWGGAPIAAWLRALVASLVVAGGVMLVAGLSRERKPFLERLSLGLWVAMIGLHYTLRYLAWSQVLGSSRTFILYALTHVLDLGLYLVMGVGLFLWIALQRRPASDPNSWAA